MELVEMTLSGMALLGAALFAVVCLLFRNVVTDKELESNPAAKKQPQDIFYCNYNLFGTVEGRKFDVVMEKLPNGSASVTITEAEDWTSEEKVEQYTVEQERFDQIRSIVEEYGMSEWEENCPRKTNPNNHNEIMVQIQGTDGNLYCDDSRMPKDGNTAFREILETMTQDLKHV